MAGVPTLMTIGIVEVARFAASAGGVPPVTTCRHHEAGGSDRQAGIARGSGGPFGKARRADQGRDCGAAEIQRIAENAPRCPDVSVTSIRYKSMRVMWGVRAADL